MVLFVEGREGGAHRRVLAVFGDGVDPLVLHDDRPAIGVIAQYSGNPLHFLVGDAFPCRGVEAFLGERIHIQGDEADTLIVQVIRLARHVVQVRPVRRQGEMAAPRPRGGKRRLGVRGALRPMQIVVARNRNAGDGGGDKAQRVAPFSPKTVVIPLGDQVARVHQEPRIGSGRVRAPNGSRPQRFDAVLFVAHIEEPERLGLGGSRAKDVPFAPNLAVAHPVAVSRVRLQPFESRGIVRGGATISQIVSFDGGRHGAGRRSELGIGCEFRDLSLWRRRRQPPFAKSLPGSGRDRPPMRERSARGPLPERQAESRLPSRAPQGKQKRARPVARIAGG